MKQSTRSSSNCLSASFVAVDEIEISNILLSLPNLIHEFESQHMFSVTWGAKRRRSAIDLSSTSPSSLPSSLLLCQSQSESERKPKSKIEASSPTTPLSLSPSESDDKSKQSRKKTSRKRTREEWLEIIEGLVQQGELLRREIETVKSYHEKLEAFNLILKAKKQELRFCLAQPQDHHIHWLVHQQQCISGNFQYSYGQNQMLSSDSRLGKVNNVVPLGIPDLNIAPEETFAVDLPQPLDHNREVADNRSKAAEARRKRMVKIREMKNSIKPQRS